MYSNVYTMNAILEERSVLRDRLSKVQKAVHKATEEAVAASNLPSPRSIVNDNASFMLGMSLFGQDVSVLERAVRDKLEDVEEEWKKLLAIHNDDENLGNSVDQEDEDEDDLDPQELAEQAEIYQQKINFLKKASWARTCLDESQTLTSSALIGEPNLVQASEELVKALEHVTQAQEIIDQSTSSADQDAQVAHQILESLRQAIRRHRIELVHKACNILDTSVQIAPNGLSSKGMTRITSAYQVLETLEGGDSALETTLRQLTQRLYREVLSPLLEPHKHQPSIPVAPWKVTESADKPTKGLIGVSTTSKKGPVHRLEWHRDDSEVKLSTPIELWKDTMTLLQQILEFVSSKILLGRPSLCQIVGDRLLGKPNSLPTQLNLQALGLDESLSAKTVLLGEDKGILIEEILELMSKTCIPDSLEASELSGLATRGNELQAICDPFCKALLDNQMIPPDQTTKLMTFCQNFVHAYVNHRRCVLLNEARDILQKNDYHKTVEVGVEVNEKEDDGMSIFQLHRSSISETSSKIMVLLRKTMDEAVAVQPGLEPPLNLLRPTLYRTAREMLSLFRAIIPASHGGEVAHVPRTAALLHNDCVFLAHHCLTLGLEYKEQLGVTEDDVDARGKLLQQTCLFVDMVPLFRDLADQSMNDMLDLQKHQLAEIVGSRISYLGKALQSDESLHEWSEAETALAAGIYHLRHLSQAWKPVLSSQVFARSMGYLADAIFTLYLQQIFTQAVDISPSAHQFMSGLINKAMDEIRRLLDNSMEGSSVWERFEAVGKFFGMQNLGEVERALGHGVFSTLVSQELVQLIQGSYLDTAERRSLLQTLASV